MTPHFFLRALEVFMFKSSHALHPSAGEKGCVRFGGASRWPPAWRCSRALPVHKALLVTLSLSAMPLVAHADLWAYVDDRGITHFAIEQVDDRYELFFKSSDTFNFLQLTPDETGAAVGVKATGKAGEPAFKVPTRFARLDSSKSYKAVQKHIQEAAHKHLIDYSLIKAVIAAESGFDPAAVSPKGAVGLMQLMPTTAEQYGVVADRSARMDRRGKLLPAQSVEQKLIDPRTNIQAGSRYLAYLLKMFKGELPLALAAYNAGEGAVQRAGNKIPNYKETQGYVKTVLGLYEVFKPPASLPAVSGSAAFPTGVAIGQSSGRMRVEFGGMPTASVKANPPMLVDYGAPLLADSVR